MFKGIAIALLSTIFWAGAGAPNLAAPAEKGRFSMMPTEDGVLRLDTVTGAMSLCHRADGKWSCKAIEDDYAAQCEELDRLARENEQLRAENRRLREAAPEMMPDIPDEPEERRRLDLPSDEEVDKMLGFLERFLRRFKDMMDRLEDGDDRKVSI